MNILQDTKTELNDWVSDSFNKKFMYEQSYQHISNALNSESRGIGTDLSSLSYWYGMNGIFKISTDIQGACSDFHNMFFSAFIRMQCSYKIYQKTSKVTFWQSLMKKELSPRFFLDEHTELLGNAIALGFIEEAKTIGGIISTLLEQKMYFALKNEKLFPRYILELFYQWNKLPFSPIYFSKGIQNEYKLLLTEMETASSERYGELLENCCDLHLENSGDLEDEGVEFSSPVEILFPTEVLMTYQIRKMTVNSISENIHHLIDNYLVLPQLLKTTQLDPLLSELKNKIISL
jgi:hypothetical protein